MESEFLSVAPLVQSVDVQVLGGSSPPCEVEKSLAWGCDLLDDNGDPLALSADGTLTKVWNFSELEAALLDAEVRLLQMEPPTGVLPPPAEAKSNFDQVYITWLQILLLLYYENRRCVAIMMFSEGSHKARSWLWLFLSSTLCRPY
ncbi:hypothetical protein KC19_VG060000 [Ceratodon purpureus]|uniref:Uncharacterized protein n=1 Tax=Ceratodon purpureus TaxID=3225 RepID=A0A8T0HMG1_CERPU|nr:hypothetical protein KC19_VG060000 [Ceratodon purpureus]